MVPEKMIPKCIWKLKGLKNVKNTPKGEYGKGFPNLHQD